jgi:hypothetical protein
MLRLVDLPALARSVIAVPPMIGAKIALKVTSVRKCFLADSLSPALIASRIPLSSPFCQ